MATVTPPGNGTNYVTVAPERADESMLDVDEADVRALYEEHGAILFRGFPFDVDLFARFTRRYCSGSVPNLSGGREVIDDDANIQTVNLGNDVFPLHPEMSREPWRPDTCFFACETPPTADGETTLCDGVAIVEHLPPRMVETLKTRRLLYRLPAEAYELEYWVHSAQPTDDQLKTPREGCPYVFEREGDEIFRSFTAPMLHRPMFHPGLAFGNFLLFAWFYQKQNFFPMLDIGRPVDARVMATIKRVSDELTVPISWQAGDLVMIDNTRFMHGRNQGLPDDVRRILTYFGYIKSPRLTEEHYPDSPWRRGDVSNFAMR